MSGLSYLSNYDSDSDNNETSERKNILGINDVKRPRLPVPTLKNIIVVPSEEHKDNFELHNGRKRSFPHMRGYWSTSLSVKVPKGDIFAKIQEKLKKEVLKLESSVKQLEELHVSLSKTFVLYYHQIVPFTSSLSHDLNNTHRFEIAFDCVDVYTNEDKNTTFIALRLDKLSQDYLLRITKIIDKNLAEFKLPPFYENPSFHASILWISGDKKELIATILKDLNEIVKHELGDSAISFTVNQINCKSGNKYFQYNLI